MTLQEQLAQERRHLWREYLLGILRSSQEVPWAAALEAADTAVREFDQRFAPVPLVAPASSVGWGPPGWGPAVSPYEAARIRSELPPEPEKAIGHPEPIVVPCEARTKAAWDIQADYQAAYLKAEAERKAAEPGLCDRLFKLWTLNFGGRVETHQEKGVDMGGREPTFSVLPPGEGQVDWVRELLDTKNRLLAEAVARSPHAPIEPLPYRSEEERERLNQAPELDPEVIEHRRAHQEALRAAGCPTGSQVGSMVRLEDRADTERRQSAQAMILSGLVDLGSGGHPEHVHLVTPEAFAEFKAMLAADAKEPPNAHLVQELASTAALRARVRDVRASPEIDYGIKPQETLEEFKARIAAQTEAFNDYMGFTDEDGHMRP